ncbi:MAG TPA: 30S ribosomal protein S2 [Rhodospirillaceae bacterium]|nr:30S ribosomal protein S2 [Rhodospirillaceae bacterium]
MAMPSFTMRQLLEAGVHFGHPARRWNPRMAPYIFGERNGIHIIDLEQTVPMLHRALEAVREVAQNRGRVLFVGTKRQATDIVKEAAMRCAQNYVNHRWLGGMLTNWKTISNSIKRLKQLEDLLKEENVGLTKKELLGLERERNKLDRALGGIKEMAGLPDIVVIVDTNKESIAVQEARKLSIPTIGILDSNSDPEGISMPVPGNDDAMRAISLYCNLFADAVLDGLQAGLMGAEGDPGEGDEAPAENLDAGEETTVTVEKKPAAKPAAAVEASADEAQAQETKAEDAPAEEAPAAAETAPEEEASTEDSPSGESPAEDAEKAK